jgi:RNA polymerase sigma-70 factor (ECF subfamily)
MDVQRAREPDDAQLIRQTLAGDGGAADQLVRRYLADVYAVALRVLSDVDMAQDATQETFVNALRALRSFRGDASFRTWLLRIAMNCARSGVRRSRHRREVGLDALPETVAQESDAAQTVVERAEAQRILRLLDQLPEKQRLAVSLRVNQGLSYQEIGRVLDCTEGAARVNYHLGMKRLKELVQ